MPADVSMPEVSARHSDASQPYPCSRASTPPGTDWGLDYGCCRTSLDYHASKHTGELLPRGSGDPRCPANCPHKAPLAVAKGFMERFDQGVPVAIAWVKAQLGDSHGK